MGKKKTLEEEINEFFKICHADKLCSFLRDIIPLFELYDVADEGDWVRDEVGEENEANIRLIRTAYLMSRIAEFHGGMLISIKCQLKDLYRRMEKENQIEVEE